MMLHDPFQCISPKFSKFEFIHLQSPIEPLKNPGLPNENQTHLELEKQQLWDPEDEQFKVYSPSKVPIPKNQTSLPTSSNHPICSTIHAVDLAALYPGFDLGRSGHSKARFMPQPCNVNGSRRTMQLHEGIREPGGAEVTHLYEPR